MCGECTYMQIPLSQTAQPAKATIQRVFSATCNNRQCMSKRNLLNLTAINLELRPLLPWGDWYLLRGIQGLWDRSSCFDICNYFNLCCVMCFFCGRICHPSCIHVHSFHKHYISSLCITDFCRWRNENLRLRYSQCVKKFWE